MFIILDIFASIFAKSIKKYLSKLIKLDIDLLI